MGRHSLPDPEDSGDEDSGDEEPGPYDEHDAGYGSGFSERGYAHDDAGRAPYPDAGYPWTEPPEPDYPERRYYESEYDQPGSFFDDRRFDDRGFDDYGFDGFDDRAGPEPGRGDSASGQPPYPPPPAPPSGPQHGGDWEGGEWTGSHRAVTNGRRGISVSVIVALVAVVVVVGAFILWRFFGSALSDRGDVAAARCVDGELAVPVLTDPSITEHVQTLAVKYNETASPVGDRCVQVGVKSAESDQVINGFADRWPDELGERPALWVPGSSVSEARLEAAVGADAVSDSRSLVSSPVVLAVQPQLKDALDGQSWATLPSLQTNPSALDELDRPGWGSLRLALPLTGNSDASYLAGEAVAAATAPEGEPATAGVSAVNSLVSLQPDLPDDMASTAMDALTNAADPATAPVHAVVTTEQQLHQHAESQPDGRRTVDSWLPPGPTATADYPTVLLSGDWLSQQQVSAASEFARFMRKPEQLAELGNAGFRAEGTSPPQSDVTDFGPVSAQLSVGDKAMRADLAETLATPAGSPAVTVMLDRSMNASEGDNTRMGNVVNALIDRVGALAPSSAVGLWTFDGTSGESEVTIGPLAEPVDGQSRSQVLTTTLDEQSSTSGGAVSFTTLRLVYNEALANFRPGQPNSVLVITAGPHTDQTLDGAGLQDFVRQAFDPARPVAVNVIDFESDSDQSTWEAVSRITGGSYRSLPTSDSAELAAAITEFLG